MQQPGVQKLNNGFVLRPATNADAAAVTRVVFSVLGEYGLSPDPEGTDADLRDIEASYIANGGSFHVLTDSSGTIAGSLGLYPVSAKVCELRKMYLLRPARGQGLGRYLLEDAVKRARELKFTTMVLETATVLREAVRLYEAFGFRPYQPEHVAKRCDAAYYLDL